MEGLIELDETMDVMIISDENEMGQVRRQLSSVALLMPGSCMFFQQGALSAKGIK